MAITLLGIAMTSAGSAMVEALRRSERALARQRAAARATEILDSLRLAGPPASGAADWQGGRVHWTVEPAPQGCWIRLTIEPVKAPPRHYEVRGLVAVPVLDAWEPRP